MDKMGYEQGLIKYTTENRLSGKGGHVLRPRIYVYATMLMSLIIGVLWSINDRVLLRADLLRDRNALYRELSDDRIENVYTLKLVNMDFKTRSYKIEVVGNDDILLLVSPQPTLEAEEVGSFVLRMQAPVSIGHGSMKVDVRFSTTDEPVIERTISARFLLPFE
jgi:polyferredoxin